MSHGDDIDLIRPIEAPNAGEKIADGKRPFHLKAGQTEGQADVLDASPFADEAGEGFAAVHLVGIEAGDILDQGGFQRRRIVPGFDHRAGQRVDINRENREQRIQAEADRRALVKIDKAVAGIMAAIEDGLYQPAMKARMAELEDERCEIAARLAEAPQGVPDVHPGMAEIYKRKVAALTKTLGDPNTRLDASSDIRSLVGKIILHPGTKRGEVHATLHGSLVRILDFVNDVRKSQPDRVITKLVSGSPG